MNARVKPPLSTAAEAVQASPKNDRATLPFGLRAAWLKFANELELRRLAKLHLRIERKQAAMHVLVAERQRIMNRCIRRMRRQRGLDL